MTVETTTTFTADEVVGVTLECPNCQTTVSAKKAAALPDHAAVQWPSCQGWLWVQGLPNRELDFVRALFALQQNIAANAVHPPNTKPVTVRLILPLPSAG